MIGAHRRVISAAFSVESSAKVISLGQVASWAAGAADQREHHEQRRRHHLEHAHARLLSCGRRAQIAARRIRGRHDVHAHHHGHDEQDHRGRLSIVEGPDGVPQVEADAAAARPCRSPRPSGCPTRSGAGCRRGSSASPGARRRRRSRAAAARRPPPRPPSGRGRSPRWSRSGACRERRPYAARARACRRRARARPRSRTSARRRTRSPLAARPSAGARRGRPAGAAPGSGRPAGPSGTEITAARTVPHSAMHTVTTHCQAYSPTFANDGCR